MFNINFNINLNPQDILKNRVKFTNPRRVYYT